MKLLELTLLVFLLLGFGLLPLESLNTAVLLIYLKALQVLIDLLFIEVKIATKSRELVLFNSRRDEVGDGAGFRPHELRLLASEQLLSGLVIIKILNLVIILHLLLSLSRAIRCRLLVVG